MATTRSIQIPNVRQDSSYLSRLKKQLYAQGFRNKKNYEGAKLISATKYWWDGFTINIVNGPTMYIPGGYFFAYVYTYPDYKINKKTIIKEDARAKEYYDDSIDELLGGAEEKLGG